MSGQTTGKPAGLRRDLSHAVAWNVVFAPVKLVVDTLANIIKINLLSKAEVGTLSLLSSTTSTLGMLTDLGIDHALPKFIPEAEQTGGQGAVRAFLKRIVGFKLLILALALLAAPLWGQLLLDYMRGQTQREADRLGQDAVSLLQEQLGSYGLFFLAAVALLVLLGSLYDTLRTYLVSFFRQKAWNAIAVLAALLLPLLSVAAVLLGLGVLGVVAATVLTTLLSVLVTAWHVRRVMRQQRGDAGAGQSAVPGALWRRFLPYALTANLMLFTDYFSSQYFSVYWLDGLEDTAVYWVAYSLIKQIQSLVYTPMVGLQLPLFTRVRAEGDLRLPRVFGTLARLMILLMLPAGVLLAPFLRNLLLIQFPDYQGSIEIGLVLIPFLFLEPFWGLGHNLLMAHEHYRGVIWSRLASLSSIPLLALLVPAYGPIGAGLAIGTGRTLAGLVVLGVALRSYRLGIPWRFAGKVLLASLLTAAVVAPLPLLLSMPAGVKQLSTRVYYLGLTLGSGLLALALLAGLLRWLRVLQDEDRALLGEIRHPLARRIQKFL